MKHETHKKLIVANWKMNPSSVDEAKQLSHAVRQGIRDVKNAEIVLCPPFPYLERLKMKDLGFKIGGQDCHWEQKGPYTGAVSPAMLKDIGCEYVIVGHSERKQYFGETNEIINKKVKAALKAGLKVILCIGEETRDTFDSRGHWTHELDLKVKDQIADALRDIKKSQIQNIVVAYEPVWAVGTGNPATPDDVLSAKIFVKKIISNLYNRKEAGKVRVLYGGSTDRKNAASFIKDGQADGLLVGGASLDKEEFVEMIKNI